MIDRQTLRGIVESLLFVADEPLSLTKLAQLVGEEEETILAVVSDLMREYAEQNRGFQLREVGGGYGLYTHPGYAAYVEKLVLSSDQRRLTRAALETLAIIAYKQPVTKAEISAIRGVNVDTVLASLQDKDLIREVAREKSPGQPILYGTTQTFLEKFGLKDISNLPPLEEFEPNEEAKRQIRINLISSQEVEVENQQSLAETEVDGRQREEGWEKESEF